MKTLHGFPVVTAQDCFAYVREAGLKPWPIQDQMPLEQWLAQATESQRKMFEKFGPKSFYLKITNPRTGEVNDYFRTVFKPSAVVFAMLQDYVLVTAEWKHGNDKITFVPVAGVPNKDELALPIDCCMSAAANREWQEETGTKLEVLEPLSPTSGIYSAVRPATLSYHPFVGIVQEPIVRGPTKYDDNEHIVLVAFQITEWLNLIEWPSLWDDNLDFGLEMCARDVTYAALRRLGRFKLV
ncbi:MAG: hypothetical protein HYT15_03025 [Candidatus Magasanikbacteria bacterium]|nr:hypothetical protein [Candidatus Magasanikbacteria bacterium]